MQFMGLSVQDIPFTGKYIPVNIRRYPDGFSLPVDEMKAIIPPNIGENDKFAEIEGYGVFPLMESKGKIADAIKITNKADFQSHYPDYLTRTEYPDIIDATAIRSFSKFFYSYTPTGRNGDYTAMVKPPKLITSNVTSTDFMFCRCENLESVEKFDTSAVTDMTCMFQCCFKLEKVPVFNTLNVKKTQNMFDACRALKEAPEFDLSNVQDTTMMFSGCTNLLSVPEYELSSATEIRGMFASCSSLNNISVNASVAKDASNLFVNDEKLQNIKRLSIPQVTNTSHMFQLCKNLKEVPPLDYSKVTDATSMFDRCVNLETIHGIIDFASITDQSKLPKFSDCKKLTGVKFKNMSHKWGNLGLQPWQYEILSYKD